MSEYFYYTTPDHPLAEPLVTQLTAEYDRRYGAYFGETADKEMSRYPASAFAPPEGNFLLLLRDGFPIAGGAFKRYDEETAELKRIWTDENNRRQGLARRICAELEQQALKQGYSKLYLTTGFRQPEARDLYLSTGYTPLFDVDADPELYGALAFEKFLVPPPVGYVPTLTTPPEGGWKAARERQLAAHR